MTRSLLCFVICMYVSDCAASAAPPSTQASLYANRVPHPKPVPGVIPQMSTKELGNFDFDADKGGLIPADVVVLDGTTIRLTGFMIPMDRAEHITRFALVSDLNIGPNTVPLIQETIVVNLVEGKVVDYFPDRIIVHGTLHVRERKEDGFLVSIFDIDATSVYTAKPSSTQPH